MKKNQILIVDDTDESNQLLGAILRKAGYETIAALSGNEALHLLDEFTPDLIMLDVIMPDIDGYEVCKIIRKREGLTTLPVIFLTGKTDTSDLVKAFDVGATDFVTKPFKSAELLARVRLQLELKEARDDLRTSNAELEKMIKDKDKFISIISHDLRSPFQGILGLSNLLKKEYDSYSKEEIVSIIGIMDASLNSFYKLIENLLSWSLLKMGKYKMYGTRVNAANIVQSQIELYDIQLKEKQINITRNCDLTASLITDEQSLSTIIRNLISNAVKFTPNSGEVQISVQSDSSGRIVFSVKDSGCGLEPEVLKRVLSSPGSGLKSLPGTNSEQGSGIGLMLSRELVQLMGGEIQIDTKKDVGTQFTCIFPAEIKLNQD